MKRLIAVGLLTQLLCMPLLPFAAERVPDAGLRAEMQGRWTDAIAIYQRALARKPSQAHLWRRIADIQAHLGNPQAAAEALIEATRHAPKDPVLFFRLAQAHASANQPEAALAAINEAVKLDPARVEYLRTRAILANWNQDFATAQDSHARILAQLPGDPEANLGMARSSLWNKDYDSAAKAYRTYAGIRPYDKAAMMEYINVETERGEYAAALQVGETYRQRFGDSLEYWQRMAEIHALAGDDRAAADAIDKATRHAPGDPDLYYQLSQRHAAADDPKQALAAINRAVELEPRNLEYLRTRADLAAWDGNYDAAQNSFERIRELAPDDAGALLGIARTQTWKGETDTAIRTYKDYLVRHPDVAVAWIEYASAETDNGNYAVAMDVLERFRERFGETTSYRKQKARTLAWTERPTPSLAIVSELRPEMPDDYELNYTRTIALSNDHQPRAAVDSFAELIRLRPDSKETADIQRYVNTPLRSTVTLLGGYRDDSDDIAISHLGAEGVYVASPDTRFWLAGDRLWLDAPVGSGFETVDGSEDVGYTRVWGGARHLMSSKWSLYGTVGGGSVEGGDDEIVYEVGVDVWPRDGLGMRLFRNQDIYAVSPRAVSLGIQRRANQLNWSWSPDLRYTVDGILGYSTFSDDNDRWDIALAPRRAMVRNQRLNLDLGVGAYWFGFDDDPGNGYYAPSNYQRYTLNAFSYWKLSDDDGISLTLSVGPYKDDTMDDYSTTFDVVGEGFFGIYRDWMLNVSGSFSQNTGVATGAYQDWVFEIAITRRF